MVPEKSTVNRFVHDEECGLSLVAGEIWMSAVRWISNTSFIKKDVGDRVRYGGWNTTGHTLHLLSNQGNVVLWNILAQGAGGRSGTVQS
jgi:hypothetical protein